MLLMLLLLLPWPPVVHRLLLLLLLPLLPMLPLLLPLVPRLGCGVPIGGLTPTAMGMKRASFARFGADWFGFGAGAKENSIPHRGPWG